MNKCDNPKIGFIGCGKMAGAIIKGIITSNFVPKENLMGAEINNEIAQLAQSRLGIDVIRDNRQLVRESNVIFVATKPGYVADVLEEIKNSLTPEKLVVSIAAGVTIKKIEKIIGKTPVVRVMPNTPALLLEGMSGVSKGTYAQDSDVEFVMNLLSSIGKTIRVEEKQMDIVTAISGSGPAFFYKVIEDIARAGEKLGLDYDKSLLLATQTALGSAKMVSNRGELTVEDLINNVATKGGCTFVGINTMKENHSDKLFYEVVEATSRKACELGN
ncbi:MAG: pyrroline-5-carboxylate reductase [Heliobacteriaceae bacterium]|jgi:pyrroline-5-carboxylate reductase|nr:pyrroline-5-carboxylate reductase [Heliobacteriaceae bacterium]